MLLLREKHELRTLVGVDLLESNSYTVTDGELLADSLCGVFFDFSQMGNLGSANRLI